MPMTYSGEVHISQLDVTRNLREVIGAICLKRDDKNVMCRECLTHVFKFQRTGLTMFAFLGTLNDWATT